MAGREGRLFVRCARLRPIEGALDLLNALQVPIAPSNEFLGALAVFVSEARPLAIFGGLPVVVLLALPDWLFDHWRGGH